MEPASGARVMAISAPSLKCQVSGLARQLESIAGLVIHDSSLAGCCLPVSVWNSHQNDK